MAPLSSPPPSMKLLASHPKSRPKPITVTGAASSSTAAMPPHNRSTRNLPNLCDCHCCGRRIDRANPKDHLQALDSVWRIVLLCRKCCKTIHSGQTCSYCFRETANSQDLCQCRLCRRKIHKDCVRGFTNCSPWCNLGVGTGLDEFGVCVDCWVPELLKNSVRVCKRGEKKRGRKHKAKAEAEQLLENKALKDPKCDNGRVKMVKTEKKQRTNVMENVVDLEKGATPLNSSSGAIDAAELANQSNGAMDSIPRTLNLGDAMNIRASNCVAYENSGLVKASDESQRLGTSNTDTDSERMVLSAGNGLCNDPDGNKKELLPHHRNGKRKLWKFINTSTVVSEANQQMVMIGLYSDDTRTLNPVTGTANIPEITNEVDADKSYPCNSSDKVGQLLLSDTQTGFTGEMWYVNGSYDIPECSSVANSLGKDANRLNPNVRLLTYKRDRKRKKWQLNGESNVVSGSSNEKVMVNLHLDDENMANVSEGSTDVNPNPSNPCRNVDRFGREFVYKRTKFRQKACQANDSVDVPTGSTGINTQVTDVNGAKLGMLTYKRDRNRKRWKLDDANTVLSQVIQQKVKFNLYLDDAKTMDPTGSMADLPESSIDVNSVRANLSTNVDESDQEFINFKSMRLLNAYQVNGPVDAAEGSGDVNRPNVGFVPYKQDSMLMLCQLNGKSTVVSEVSEQEKKSELHSDYARIQDAVSSSSDLSEGSFDVNSDQSNQCANVPRFGQELLCSKLSRFSQEVCHVNDSNDVSEGSVDVNGICSISGLTQGVLAYRRDRKRKIWELNGGSTGHI